jgi:hypothetical protein
MEPVLTEPVDTDTGSSAGERILLGCGVAGLVLVLVVGYFAYLSPAMLIEFASLRLCN